MSIKNITKATLRLAIYDPLQLNEQDFLNTFVARHTVLKRMLRHIRENAGRTMLRHRLVFGQRGMGKTSLLRRVALGVREDPSLSWHWIPLNFREEQYNIGKLDHFWKNCADALADWCEKQGDIESAGRLDNAVISGKRLYRAIRETAETYGKRLLLLVDNINLILASLPKEDQWKLREILQSKDAPMMIACTPVHVPQLADRKGPFYDFFSMDDLGPLPPTEMRECLTRLAQTRGEPGQEVLENMRRFPQRIQVMHTLCGGNPRTLVLIYQVLETVAVADGENQGDIGQLLEGVLENTTPLYKARTEELSQQQRRIIDAVALEWDPVDAGTIARKTDIPPTSLSAPIKRLQNDGLLQQVTLGPKRKGVQLAERFYNIWYLMRHGTRRNRLRLRWLSRFLTTYYSTSELHSQARRLISDRKAIRDIYNEALMHAIEDAPLQNALRLALTRPLIGKESKLLKDLLPGEDYEPRILEHARRQEKMVTGFIKSGSEPQSAEQLSRLIAESFSLNIKEKQAIADKAEALNALQKKELLEFFEEEKQRADQLLGNTRNEKIRTLLCDGSISSIENPKEALTTLACKEDRDLIEAFLMIETFNAGTKNDIEKFYAHCRSTPPSSARAWNGLGNLLQNHLNRFDESETAYRKAIALDPNFAYPWHGLGNLLQNHLNRFDESETAYRKAVELDPNFAHPWYGLGNLLQNHLNRFDESETAYRKAITLDPNSAYPWTGLGNLLQDHLNRLDESETAYLESERLNPEYPTFPKANRAWLRLKRGDRIKAENLIDEVELPFPGKELLLAGRDLVEGNPGTCCEKLKPVLKENPPPLWTTYRDDLLRLTRLFKAHHFETFYMDFLKQNQFDLSLEPYAAAAEAYFFDRHRLLRLNPEARTVAGDLYGWLVSYRMDIS